MNPDIFTPEESQALKRCITGISHLTVYCDPEFSEIFGLSKEGIKEVERNHPDWDLYDENESGCDDSGIAVRNAFAWVMNGTEEEKRILRKHLDLTEDLIGEE